MLPLFLLPFLLSSHFLSFSSLPFYFLYLPLWFYLCLSFGLFLSVSFCSSLLSHLVCSSPFLPVPLCFFIFISASLSYFPLFFYFVPIYFSLLLSLPHCFSLFLSFPICSSLSLFLSLFIYLFIYIFLSPLSIQLFRSLF